MHSFQAFHGTARSTVFEIARGLLQIGAVELRPNNLFTWSSGWKSPIYCDNRLVLGSPLLRDLVVEGFESCVSRQFPGLDVVVGTATAGIAHAAMVADRLGLPTAYVRSSAKEHGKQKRTEGRIRQGDRAVVVEDTLSTGKSAYSAVDALLEEGADVLAVLSIVSYDFDSAAKRAEAIQVPAYRLVDYDTLIRVAEENGYVSSADVDLLLSWRAAPETFGR